MALSKVLKEKLCCIICDKSTRNDAPYASKRGDSTPHCLGENGVEINVSSPAKWIVTRISQKTTLSFGLTRVIQKRSKEFGRVDLELHD